MDAELLKNYGPWALFLIGLIVATKYLVTDKLNAIMSKLAMVDRHEVELAEIKTALRMNGCMEAGCRRREDFNG